jgi:hypothetical protein
MPRVRNQIAALMAGLALSVPGAALAQFAVSSEGQEMTETYLAVESLCTKQLRDSREFRTQLGLALRQDGTPLAVVVARSSGCKPVDDFLVARAKARKFETASAARFVRSTIVYEHRQPVEFPQDLSAISPAAGPQTAPIADSPPAANQSGLIHRKFENWGQPIPAAERGRKPQ